MISALALSFNAYTHPDSLTSGTLLWKDYAKQLKFWEGVSWCFGIS